MNAHSKPVRPVFSYRTERCDQCDSAHGGYDCETCGGSCEIDSWCVECHTITALNDAELCERCAEDAQLTVCEGDPMLRAA